VILPEEKNEWKALVWLKLEATEIQQKAPNAKRINFNQLLHPLISHEKSAKKGAEIFKPIKEA
jgi:hypothetical protein